MNTTYEAASYEIAIMCGRCSRPYTVQPDELKAGWRDGAYVTCGHCGASNRLRGLLLGP